MTRNKTELQTKRKEKKGGGGEIEASSAREEGAGRGVHGGRDWRGRGERR